MHSMVAFFGIQLHRYYFMQEHMSRLRRLMRSCFMVAPLYVFHSCLPHPADPTLTTENLMEVVKGRERRWEDLAGKLVVRYTKITEIKAGYHDEIRRMEEVIKEYVRYIPNHSWDHFARVLQSMGLHQLGDAVTDKYVRGIIMICGSIVNT